MTTPKVVAAAARELGRVRVSFEAPVKQAGGTARDDALCPANYSLTSLSAPAVEAQVTAVEPVTASAVDLMTNTALTPSALYRVDVVNVADLDGSEIEPPASVLFTGFVPSRPPQRSFDLYSLLPAVNRREDDTGDLRKFTACLQEVLDLLLADIDGFTDLFDPDLAPEWALDLMLGELGNPFPLDLSVVDKRRLIGLLVAIYREKGTSIGITNAIRFFLGVEVVVTSYTGEALRLGESLLGEDWVLGPESAFFARAFEVAAPRLLTEEERKRLRQIVNYMRPAQTHFVRLTEPEPPADIEHAELGLSELGDTFILH